VKGPSRETGAVAATVVVIIACSVLVTTLPLQVPIAVVFEEIDWGIGSGVTTRMNITITNLQAWEELWQEVHSVHFPMPDLPEVDFSTDMVIAVFQGERTVLGYSSNITRVNMVHNRYEVHIDEVHPGPDDLILNAFCQPYRIVRIPNAQLDLPVYFFCTVRTR
jgi:hypothetical protein